MHIHSHVSYYKLALPKKTYTSQPYKEIVATEHLKLTDPMARRALSITMCQYWCTKPVTPVTILQNTKLITSQIFRLP